MRARYYNTDIKRFINRDVVDGTIANSQSLNRYSYVQGNPVSLTDPFGLSPIGGDIMSILSQQGHTALDVLGFFWDGFDLINAAWYAAEGNTLMAASCAVSAIPFLGSMVAGGTKLAIAGAKAVKAADCIKEVSVMVGFTGIAVVGAINTAQAYKDYKEAKANGTATFSDELNVALNALLTVGAGVCALATATKMTTKIKSGGVGDSVKASAKDNMSGNNKGYASGKGKSKGGKNSILSYEEAENIAFDSIHGSNKSDAVVLGKFGDGGPTAYTNVAKDMNAQYFQLDNWDELASRYSDDEIWKINEKFLDIQTSSGREIYLSHNPLDYIGKGQFILENFNIY